MLKETKDSFSAEGRIARFYFKSRSDDYHVALFVYDDGQAVVTGNLYGAEEKERIYVEGEWYDHKKYGRQVMVTMWNRPLPATEEQAVAFLSSGLVKGVGPVTARRIVEKLGPDAVKVIMERGEEALRGIKGLRSAQKVCESIRDTYEVQRAVSQLLPLGISASTAIKAHKKFGGAAVELVKRDPYCLMGVDGIGFHRADAIARKLGVPLDSAGRIAGAVSHVLDEAVWNEGHCFLVREELVKKALELLNRGEECVAAEQVDGVIKNLAMTDRLVVEAGAVYTPAVYRAEAALAEKVKRLRNAPENRVPEERVERAIKRYELREGIRLAAEQKQAVIGAMKNKLLVLTGGPGVGKTTAVRAVISVYEGLFGKRALLVSPTGKASRRLSEVTGREASTIHRLLGLSHDLPLPVYNRNNPLPCGLLVVDEVSMMGVGTAKLLFDAVGEDTRVLLVGDADQLPSVEPGNFLADLLAAGVPSVRLEKVFRQALQSQIVAAAYKINGGQAYYPDHSRGDFYFIEKEDPEKIARLVVRCVERLLELGYSLEDVQVLSPMKNGPVGTKILNQMLQDRLNPASGEKGELAWGETVFRVGDRVMCVRNNYEKGDSGVFNGETGVVTRVVEDKDGAADGLTVRFDWGEVEYDRKDLRDLELAYAITVHKSQGSEHRAVVMPLTTSHYIMLSRKVVYTAVTRARERVVLVGTKKAYWIAVKNNDLAARNTRLAERISSVAFLDFQGSAGRVPKEKSASRRGWF